MGRLTQRKETTMNLNTKLYQELKEKNAISITRIGNDMYAFIIKQYNPYTGETLDDTIDQFSLPKLKAAIGEKQGELNGMLAILADVEALKTPSPEK